MDNFILERYFGKYEFNSKYLLCSSDCEPLLISELFELSNQNPEHGLSLELSKAPLRIGKWKKKLQSSYKYTVCSRAGAEAGTRKDNRIS